MIATYILFRPACYDPLRLSVHNYIKHQVGQSRIRTLSKTLLHVHAGERGELLPDLGDPHADVRTGPGDWDGAVHLHVLANDVQYRRREPEVPHLPHGVLRHRLPGHLRRQRLDLLRRLPASHQAGETGAAVPGQDGPQAEYRGQDEGSNVSRQSHSLPPLFTF